MADKKAVIVEDDKVKKEEVTVTEPVASEPPVNFKSAAPVSPQKEPVVIIAGIQLQPKQTGIKPAGSMGEVYVVEGREFYIPYEVRCNKHQARSESDIPWEEKSTYEPPEMSLFVFVHNKIDYYLLMDNNSTFIRDEHTTSFNRGLPGQLLMINASSRNDDFLHNNALVNVETENCVLNKTEISAVSNCPGRSSHWGGNTPFKFGQKREVYKNCRFKGCNVVDTELSEGNYSGVRFSCSTIKSLADNSWIRDSDFVDSRIRGGHMDINQCRVLQCEIITAEAISIKGVSEIKDENWNFKSILITNRFSYTEINYLSRYDRSIKMVRINEEEFELGVGWGGTVKLPLTTSPQDIEEAIKEVTRTDKEKKIFSPPLPYSGGFGYTAPWILPTRRPDSIKTHILQYAADQIISRISIIKMLDEAQEVVAYISGNHEKYTYFYE